MNKRDATHDRIVALYGYSPTCPSCTGRGICNRPKRAFLRTVFDNLTKKA